jgi:hypothetical protein
VSCPYVVWEEQSEEGEPDSGEKDTEENRTTRTQNHFRRFWVWIVVRMMSGGHRDVLGRPCFAGWAHKDLSVKFFLIQNYFYCWSMISLYSRTGKRCSSDNHCVKTRNHFTWTFVLSKSIKDEKMAKNIKFWHLTRSRSFSTRLLTTFIIVWRHKIKTTEDDAQEHFTARALIFFFLYFEEIVIYVIFWYENVYICLNHSKMLYSFKYQYTDNCFNYI